MDDNIADNKIQIFGLFSRILEKERKLVLRILGENMEKNDIVAIDPTLKILKEKNIIISDQKPYLQHQIENSHED